LSASWAALVLSTALVSRTRWNRLDFALTMIVAIVGVIMSAAQLD
jgi:di/tricarboxylate transporter